LLTLETSTEAIGVHPVLLGATARPDANSANGRWRAERRRLLGSFITSFDLAIWFRPEVGI
jgi:hypothetical protein